MPALRFDSPGRFSLETRMFQAELAEFGFFSGPIENLDWNLVFLPARGKPAHGGRLSKIPASHGEGSGRAMQMTR